MTKGVADGAADGPAAAAAASSRGGKGAGARPSHHELPSMFGPRFTNPWPTWDGDKKFGDLMKFMGEMRQLPKDGWLLDNPKPKLSDFAAAFPLNEPDYAALAAPPADAVQAVWVGHACMLVQMDGVTFLTDPVLSERASPVQFAGPRRVVPPAIAPEDPRLPALDFVLISHNHYDHLEYGSVKRIFKRYGPGLRWFVPLGLKDWFAGCGIRNVVELDWWQEAEVPGGSGVRVALTPAQHWSSRSGWDRRRTLWGSWAVLGPRHRYWFSGDTGYCPVFKEIGERYGPFDLASVPTAAYGPRWFMRPQHVDPAEGVQMHLDLKAKVSTAIHCCTFNLTTEALDEPPALLVKELRDRGMRPDEFVTLQHGAMAVVRDGVLANTPKTLPLSSV